MKKKLAIFLIVIAIILIFWLGIIDGVRYLRQKNIPENVSVTEIEDIRIDGRLTLYYDEYSGSYWLFLYKDNYKKLVMYSGGVRGELSLNIIGDNMIEIDYNYLRDVNYPMEDKQYTIDLSKKETKNVSLIYKYIE